MILHEDMHEIWDRLVDDPRTSLEIDGENLLLHIAMDAATEKALESKRPRRPPGRVRAPGPGRLRPEPRVFT
jgi:hypothetical protein